MLNDEFEAIRERFDAADQKREKIIKDSRDILKLSKQAIYSVHRGNPEDAKNQLLKAAQAKELLEKELRSNPELRSGSFSSAMEEFVEARALYAFATEEKMPSLDDLGVEPEEYLLGLADLTGELTRMAVVKATARDTATVQRIHVLLEELYGQFVKFDFRNGELRRKYDAIKYNLQKAERVLYDLSMHNAGNADE